MPYIEEVFREFTKRTIPCETEILGVRIPTIRKIAKSIPKDDFHEYLEAPANSLEEVLARGFLISRLPYEEMIDYFDSQIQLVDNWAAVDTFCASLRKTLKSHEADFLEKKVEPLLQSSKEYVTRTGVVCLLDFYVREEYLQQVFEYITKLGNRQEYYVKMALAWLIAECYTKFPSETLEFMEDAAIDKWTLNKSISKICDSYRVSGEMKDEARKLRKAMNHSFILTDKK